VTSGTRHIGRFRLEEVLGAGGMALVYRAVDEHTGAPAAVKLLADNLAADESFRRRFQREARLAARLSHPNVVRVLDAGEYEGRPWLALEYVEGETLAEVLARRSRLPAAEVVALGRQLCAGLEHAHLAGLVHRDVKPANVLVRADGSATIVDFGIARAHDSTELTEQGSVVGTASYVAPELLTGGPVTAAADLYSLGAVLFEAAAGVPVRQAGSLGELLARGTPPPAQRLSERVDDVPRALDEAVAQCLELDPAERPASAREVARLLGAADRPTAVLETVVLPPSPPPRRRHMSWSRARAGVAVATALLVVVLVVFLAWPDGSSPPPAQAPPATPREQARDLTRWLEEHS
jgi:eukaryotic-like serine/threonine-protein kinase